MIELKKKIIEKCGREVRVVDLVCQYDGRMSTMCTFSVLKTQKNYLLSRDRLIIFQLISIGKIDL